ncbi:MAG: hypothetical protein V3V81_05865 [Candidatus Bathyarchaeia archaeon]
MGEVNFCWVYDWVGLYQISYLVGNFIPLIGAKPQGALPTLFVVWVVLSKHLIPLFKAHQLDAFIKPSIP